MEKQRFYRVCNSETQQGLWYDYEGKFTGLIHNELNFCKNSELRMEFDEELVGYVSVVDSYDKLMAWFSDEDVIELQKHGFFIHVYESEDYRFYDRFQHDVMNQKTAKLIEIIEL